MTRKLTRADRVLLTAGWGKRARRGPIEVGSFIRMSFGAIADRWSNRFAGPQLDFDHVVAATVEAAVRESESSGLYLAELSSFLGGHPKPLGEHRVPFQNYTVEEVEYLISEIVGAIRAGGSKLDVALAYHRADLLFTYLTTDLREMPDEYALAALDES